MMTQKLVLGLITCFHCKVFYVLPLVKEVNIFQLFGRICYFHLQGRSGYWSEMQPKGTNCDRFEWCRHTYGA